MAPHTQPDRQYVGVKTIVNLSSLLNMCLISLYEGKKLYYRLELFPTRSPKNLVIALQSWPTATYILLMYSALLSRLYNTYTAYCILGWCQITLFAELQFAAVRGS